MQEGRYFWLDGNPVIYSEWYDPSLHSYVHATSSLRLAVPNMRQPIFDYQLSCTMMMPQLPEAPGRWVKFPCSYAPEEDIHVGYICKKPANSNTTGTAQPRDQHVLKRAKKQCPKGWTFYKSRCYRLHTFSPVYPINWIAAIQICPRNETRRNYTDGYFDPNVVYLLKVWRFKDTGFIWAGDAVEGGDACPSIMITSSGEVSRTLINCNTVSKNVICETSTIDIPQGCGPQQFTCKDGTCISNGNVCDGMYDCVDKSDEKEQTCRSVQFQCEDVNDRQNISISSYCDFVSDCNVGSDELCSFPKCRPGVEFMCKNGQCIDSTKRCNFVADCLDKSDESMKTCSWYSECANYGGFRCYSGKCIPNYLHMDLAYDCEGRFGEDEMGDKPSNPTCTDADSELCDSSSDTCMKRSEMCIFDHDHGNKNIVYGCRNMVHLYDCKDFECPGYYKCPNSYCIPHSKVCDGLWDCEGGVDERNCRNYSCPGLFRCKGSTNCLDQHQVCDGIVDCPSTNDDEKFCDLRDCPVGCRCLGYFVNCTNADLSINPNVSKNTRALFLTRNQIEITRDTFQQFYLLAVLELSYNRLTKLPGYSFKDLHNLLQLDISNNLIQILKASTFYGLVRLKRLNLLDNPITVIEPGAFDGLSSIRSLNLSNMNIQKLSNSSFTGLPRLLSLSLVANNLSSLNSGAFQHLTQLAILSMQGNRMDRIPHDVFDTMPKLKILQTDAFKFCCVAPSSVKCTPRPDEFSSCSDLMANPTLQVAIWVLGSVAVAGNIFVIIWRCRHEKLTVPTLLIMNLAISDLMMGVYLIIIASVDTYYRGTYIFYDSYWRESFLCKLCGVLSMVSSEVSVYSILLITIDRVMIIIFPFQSRHVRVGIKGAVVAVVIGWTVWTLLSILPLTGLYYFSQFYSSNAVCLPFTLTNGKSLGWEYSTVVFIVFNFVAFVAIAAGYVAIFRSIRNSRIQAKREENDVEVKLAARFTLVVVTDFICWMPIIVMSIMSICGTSFPNEVSAWLAVFVLPFNSAINPIVYTLSAVKLCKKRKKTSRSKSKEQFAYSNSTIDSTAM